MGSSKRMKSSTLVPIAEHKVCDSSDGGVLAGSVQKCSSRNGSRLSKVLRPLVKLKDAFVELIPSEGSHTRQPRSTHPAFFSMGLVMGPVDICGYEAIYYSAHQQ